MDSISVIGGIVDDAQNFGVNHVPILIPLLVNLLIYTFSPERRWLTLWQVLFVSCVTFYIWGIIEVLTPQSSVALNRFSVNLLILLLAQIVVFILTLRMVRPDLTPRPTKTRLLWAYILGFFCFGMLFPIYHSFSRNLTL